VVVVLETVAAGDRLQVALEGNAEGTELHAQAVGTVEPADIRRVAAEELESRPVERMDVEQRGLLPGSFRVRVHFEQRVVFLFHVLDAPLKINGGRNSGHDGEPVGEHIGQAERTLAAHAGAQQADARRLHVERLPDVGQHPLQQVLLRGDLGVEVAADAVRPPAASGPGSNTC
jgi:hypothetical protein